METAYTIEIPFARICLYDSRKSFGWVMVDGYMAQCENDLLHLLGYFVVLPLFAIQMPAPCFVFSVVVIIISHRICAALRSIRYLSTASKEMGHGKINKVNRDIYRYRT